MEGREGLRCQPRKRESSGITARPQHRKRSTAVRRDTREPFPGRYTGDSTDPLYISADCTPDVLFTWNFDRDPANANPRLFRINDRVFNPDVPQHCVIKGTCEEWFINNNTERRWTYQLGRCIFTLRNFKLLSDGRSSPANAYKRKFRCLR